FAPVTSAEGCCMRGPIPRRPRWRARFVRRAEALARLHADVLGAGTRAVFPRAVLPRAVLPRAPLPCALRSRLRRATATPPRERGACAQGPSASASLRAVAVTAALP